MRWWTLAVLLAGWAGAVGQEQKFYVTGLYHSEQFNDCTLPPLVTHGTSIADALLHCCEGGGMTVWTEADWKDAERQENLSGHTFKQSCANTAEGKLLLKDAKPGDCFQVTAGYKLERIGCPFSKEELERYKDGIPPESYLCGMGHCYPIPSPGGSTSDVRYMPESVDVPAVAEQHESGSLSVKPCDPPRADSTIVCTEPTGYYTTYRCEDKRRIGPFTDGLGKTHCLYFGGKP